MLYSNSQHDAHVEAYRDFWAQVLDRKMGYLARRDQRKLEDDDEWDRRNGDLNQ